MKLLLMENYRQTKFLLSNGVNIASLSETRDSVKYDYYFPYVTLLFVQKGALEIKYKNKVKIFTQGTFFLVKKHTFASLSKAISKPDGIIKVISFALEDTSIKEVFRYVTLPDKTSISTEDSIIKLPKNKMLKGFIHSIENYFDAFIEIDHNLLLLKTLESLIGILKISPELLSVFYEYSLPTRAELISFMESIYTEKLTLPEIAKLSNRSIAAFHRDFWQTFRQTPHQWIKEKRLNLAKELLLKTDRKSSEIYLQVGFEDLAHFSRSFKQQFGINPSEFKNNN